jgi:type VI secretion system protein ImpC
MLSRFSAESGQTGWTESPLFKQVFNLRFDMPGGNPFGCMVGDYQFDKFPPDITLLGRLSAICGAAHMPFISAASPNLLSLKSWREMPNIAELEAKMSTPEYASWNSLRQSPDSRYLALTLPRVLSRLPYGKDKNPVDGFNFEEDLRPPALGKWSARMEYLAGQFTEHDGKLWRALRNNSNAAPEASPTEWEEHKEALPPLTRHDNYAWANAAYPMASNIMNTFFDTGFCTAIRGVESGGKVEGLPIDTFPTDDGGIDAKCPTEVAISQRKEAELSNLGFMPLSHWQNTDFAAFVGGQTVQKPQEYETAVATDNAKLSARLPYVFMLSRFAHYLKKMIYEWVGSNRERAQLEKELNEWIMLYASAPTSAEDVKQQKPLADARIEVKEIEGEPGKYEAFAYLRPHIQLESVTVNLGVVSKLPGGA